MELSAPTTIEPLKEFPPDWRVVPLGTLIKSVEYGSSAKSAATGRVPVLRMGNLQGGQIDWNDLVFTSHEAEIKKYELKQGDVLFNRTNTIDLVGKTSLFDGSRPAIFAGYLIRVNVQHELLNTRYLTYVLNSNRSRQYGKQVLSVAVGQANINGQKLKTYPIPIPPTKPEQDAIAAVLADAEQMIASLERLVAKKRQIKQAAVQELMKPQSADAEAGLGTVSYLKGRIGWQGLKQTEFNDNTDDPFLITGMNFKDGAIRWDEVYHVSERRYQMAKDIQLQPDDILMTKDGTIGKMLFVDSIPYPGKASLNSHLLLMRPTNGSYIPRYLYYQLCSKRFANYIELNKSGTTFFGISQSAVAKYPVLLPPLSEQTRIASILSSMDATIASSEIVLAKARQVKQGMMQNLLTGKIRLV